MRLTGIAIQTHCSNEWKSWRRPTRLSVTLQPGDRQVLVARWRGRRRFWPAVSQRKLNQRRLICTAQHISYYQHTRTTPVFDNRSPEDICYHRGAKIFFKFLQQYCQSEVCVSNFGKQIPLKITTKRQQNCPPLPMGVLTLPCETQHVHLFTITITVT